MIWALLLLALWILAVHVKLNQLALLHNKLVEKVIGVMLAQALKEVAEKQEELDRD